MEAITTAARTLGVHTEVGTLRTVMVHRPDLAHEWRPLHHLSDRPRPVEEPRT